MVRSWAALWLLLATIVHLASSLHFTPGSPCTELCIQDDPDSNSNSSTINSDDIVCDDFEFTSDKAGKKFQRCMTCLQESDFAKGSESDLDSFLYNLRYSFDYCIFGDINAQALDSNPCATSEGCGTLTDALRKDMTNSSSSSSFSSSDRSQYGYCEADSQTISGEGEGFDKCLSCVSAEATRSYLSNFLIALAIGCDQRPSPGHLLGLNQTVFAKTTIQATNPSNLDPNSPNSSGLLLPTTVIVGISVGGLFLLLLALGCGYMQYRKRKNRHRASGWSFRCQARSGSMPAREMQLAEEAEEEERKRAAFNEAMEEKMWTSPSESRVTGLFPPPPASTMGGVKGEDKRGITPILTTTQPSRPAVQTSGRNFHGSPIHHDHMTPSSATSIQSSRPLLRNDSPASYSVRSFSGNHYGQAVSASRNGMSPQTPQSSTSTWEAQQQPPRMMSQGGTRTLTGSSPTSRPVEARNFNTTFPSPPRG